MKVGPKPFFTRFLEAQVIKPAPKRPAASPAEGEDPWARRGGYVETPVEEPKVPVVTIKAWDTEGP